MPTKDMTLTSVKIKSELFENFKIECVKRKFSFQKLADRAIYLYLTNEDFRKQINNQTALANPECLDEYKNISELNF